MKSNLALLLLNQILSRFFTFGLNILTVRYVGAIAFGVSSIHLYLLYSVILFLCREPFRMAILQYGFRYTAKTTTKATTPTTPVAAGRTTTTDTTTQNAVSPNHNHYTIDYLSSHHLYATMKTITTTILLTSLPLATVLATIYITNPPDLGDTTPAHASPRNALDTIMTLGAKVIQMRYNALSVEDFYVLAVLVHSFSALIELSSEHLYLYTNTQQNIKLRVSIEGLSNVARCVVTAMCVLSLHHLNLLHVGTSLMAYSAGQFVYSALLTVCYYGHYIKQLVAQQQQQMNEQKLQKKKDDDQKDSNNDNTTTTTTLAITTLSHIIPLYPHPAATSKQVTPSTEQQSQQSSPPQQQKIATTTPPPPPLSALNTDILRWYFAFLSQSILKHFLTEGEKMLLISLSPLTPKETGEYALVMNVGGLFNRLIFQPIEENSQQMFSAQHRQIVALNEQYHHNNQQQQQDEEEEEKQQQHQLVEKKQKEQHKQQKEENNNNINNNNNNNDNNDKNNNTSSQIHTTYAALQQKYQNTILLVTFIGLIVATFGTSMSYTFIRLFYGTHWSENTSAPSLLALYCIAQIFFSINGITEGFLYSTMQSPESLYIANVFMVMCSAMYLLLLTLNFKYELLFFGVLSNAYILFVINIVIMIFRIIYALIHIKTYFSQQQEQEQQNKHDNNSKERSNENDNNKKNNNKGDTSNNNNNNTITISTVISWMLPQRSMRVLLFVSFLLSNIAYTFFLHNFTANPADLTTPLFTATSDGDATITTMLSDTITPILDGVKANSTTAATTAGAVTFEHIQRDLLNLQWGTFIYNTLRSTPRSVLKGFVTPRVQQHLFAIATVVPIFLFVLYMLYRVEWRRIRGGDGSGENNNSNTQDNRNSDAIAPPTTNSSSEQQQSTRTPSSQEQSQQQSQLTKADSNNNNNKKNTNKKKKND